jgi:hypothetical protein
MPRIAYLASTATRNFTTLLALIWIVSPLAGLRPTQALRLTGTSLPRTGQPLTSYFLAALILAHLALAAAEIFAFAAALIVLLAFLGVATAGLIPLIFAHLAFCAARIFSIPAALIFLRAVFTSVTVFVSTVPDSLINSFCSSAICSLTCAARLNCDGVR